MLTPHAIAAPMIAPIMQSGQPPGPVVPFWLVSLLVGMAITAGILYLIRQGPPE